MASKGCQRRCVRCLAWQVADADDRPASRSQPGSASGETDWEHQAPAYSKV